MLLIFLFFPRGKCNLYAQECDKNKWIPRLEKIKLYLDHFESKSGLAFADSILRMTSSGEKSDCQHFLWFQYERSELLELDNRFDKALDQYYNIIHQAELQKMWDLVCHCHISIARSHESIGRKSDCLRHLNMAEEMIQIHSLEKISARLAYRKASYHRLFDSKDSAKIYAAKAVFLGKKYNFRRAITDGHLILGILEDNLDTACYHFRTTATMFAASGDFHGAASQYQNIASRQLKFGKTSQAMSTLDTAFYYVMKVEKDSKPFYQMLSSVLDKKSQIFHLQNQPDSAYHYLKKSKDFYLLAERSINQDSVSQRAIDFAIEKEKEKNVYLEKRALLFRWGFWASAAAFSLVFFLFTLNRNRRRKIEKQNIIIQNQNIALENSFQKQSTLLSEVHHRVKNNLQLVISLLTLHGNNRKDKKLNLLLDEVSGKVKSIALIHEQLYSTGEFESIHVHDYLVKLMQNFESLQGEKESFIYEIQGNNLSFNLETVMPIGIISSELVSNALKYARVHGEKLRLFIGIEKTENGYLMHFHDNGPGMKEETENHKNSKIGTSLIKSMVRQLQAESKTYNQNGYHFTMVFLEKKVSPI